MLQIEAVTQSEMELVSTSHPNININTGLNKYYLAFTQTL